MVKFFLFILLFVSCDNNKERSRACELRVLTYANFNSLLGPGKKLASEFQRQHHCKVKYVVSGDSLLLTEILKHKQRKIDVITGLDQMSLLDTTTTELLEDIAQKFSLSWHPFIKDYLSPKLLPIDWAPLTIIKHHSNSHSPRVTLIRPGQWRDLQLKKELSLQDPRTSITGLQFLWWWSSGFKRFFSKKNLHSLSPSWSTAYGLFQTERVAATFTYITSLLYEWEKTPKKTFTVVNDEQGHPVQIEFVGVLKSSVKKELAEKWVKLLMSPTGQQILMNANYMYSVHEELITGKMSELPQLKVLSKNSFMNFMRNKEAHLKSWQNALNKYVD